MVHVYINTENLNKWTEVRNERPNFIEKGPKMTFRMYTHMGRCSSKTSLSLICCITNFYYHYDTLLQYVADQRANDRAFQRRLLGNQNWIVVINQRFLKNASVFIMCPKPGRQTKKSNQHRKHKKNKERIMQPESSKDPGGTSIQKLKEACELRRLLRVIWLNCFLESFGLIL